MENHDIMEILADLVWIQALVATELIQITENTSVLARNAPPPGRCLTEHHDLRMTALAIAEKYRPDPGLRTHIQGHQ